MLAIVSVLTMTIGNVLALAQKNIKRMLAYSSIAHAGYILIGVVAYSQLGMTERSVLLDCLSDHQPGSFRCRDDLLAGGQDRMRSLPMRV